MRKIQMNLKPSQLTANRNNQLTIDVLEWERKERTGVTSAVNMFTNAVRLYYNKS